MQTRKNNQALIIAGILAKISKHYKITEFKWKPTQEFEIKFKRRIEKANGEKK